MRDLVRAASLGVGRSLGCLVFTPALAPAPVPPGPQSQRVRPVRRAGAGLCTLVLAVAFAVRAERLQAGETFELERLAAGVYAALVKPRSPTYAFANALIVIGSDSVLVVDTQQSPSAASELIAEIAKLTSAPVRFVANTHWHGDHVYGNEAYRDRFPEVLFLAHPSTRQDLLDSGKKVLEEELQSLPGSIREREERLASGNLTAEERERVEYSLGARVRYLGELRGLELHPPDLTFSEKLTLDLGGRRVELHHLGPAHTRGDVVVHLPEEKILAVGDLLEEAFPYFGDAFPSGWARALERVAAFGAGLLLPSHGRVQRDGTLLELEIRLLRSLVSEVRAARARGRTLEEMQREILLPEFRSFFAGGDREGLEAYRESVRAAVERTYREEAGEVSP